MVMEKIYHKNFSVDQFSIKKKLRFFFVLLLVFTYK